MYHSNMTMSRG